MDEDALEEEGRQGLVLEGAADVACALDDIATEVKPLDLKGRSSTKEIAGGQVSQSCLVLMGLYTSERHIRHCEKLEYVEDSSQVGPSKRNET